MEANLEELGLTKGEVKVYLALFELKEGTKDAIAKEASVSASKVYEILDKLIKKGLVAFVVRNNIKYFYPCPPTKLKEYVDIKKQKIEKEEGIVDNLIPFLTQKLNSSKPQTRVEVYEGVNGMKSVLSIFKSSFNQKEEWIAMGIRSGKKEQYNNIMINFHKERAEKRIACRLLFTDKGTEFYHSLKSMEKTEIRVLEHFTPAGIAVYGDKTAIFYYGEKPSFILITNEGISQSFKEFFNGLWKLAKK